VTRAFRESIRCVRCGLEFTAETDFERWMRGHRDLRSGDGIVRFDLDVLLHRYKFQRDGKSDRTVQAMMFVEVKTYMAEPSLCQRDTLGVLNEILRNRRKNMHQDPRRQRNDPITRVYSKVARKEITIHLYGGHLLQLSHTTPENSDRMVWDWKHVIDQNQLVRLLRFELDPDTLRAIDLRRRYMNFTIRPFLPGFYLGDGGQADTQGEMTPDT